MEKIGNSTYNKEKKTRLENLVFNTIPAAGVEPARPNGHWILSPARLPIPPRRQSITGVAGFEPTHEGVKVPCLTAWLYPNEMEESGFEPLNPKERIYSPSRLATSLLLRKVCINLT